LVQSPKGRVIARTELGEVSRMAGAPCICIHRGVLQKILLDALPPRSVRTDARCVGFDGAASSFPPLHTLRESPPQETRNWTRVFLSTSRIAFSNPPRGRSRPLGQLVDA
jgi:hypothetical protein